MALIFYDQNTNSGSGTVYFESIEGGIPIVVHQLVANDFNTADIPPPGYIETLVTRWWLFIKIINFGEAIAFTSTPEVRYKLGTLVPVGGYEIIVDESGRTVYSVSKEPMYLIYERTRTPDFVVQVVPQNPGEENYQAVWGSFSAINLNCAQVELYQNASAYRGLSSTPAIDVNLTDGVIADIQLDYVFEPTFTSLTESRTIVNIGL